MPARKKGGLTPKQRKKLEADKAKIKQAEKTPKPPPRKDVGPGPPSMKTEEELEAQRKKIAEQKKRRVEGGARPRGRPKKKEILDEALTQEEINMMERELAYEATRKLDLTDEQLNMLAEKGTLLGERHEEYLKLKGEMNREADGKGKGDINKRIQKVANENAAARPGNAQTTAFKALRDLGVDLLSAEVMNRWPQLYAANVAAQAIDPMLKGAAGVLLEGQAGPPEGFLGRAMSENFEKMISDTRSASSDGGYTYETYTGTQATLGGPGSSVGGTGSSVVRREMGNLANNINQELNERLPPEPTGYVGEARRTINDISGIYGLGGAALVSMLRLHNSLMANHPGYGARFNRAASLGNYASLVGSAWYQSGSAAEFIAHLGVTAFLGYQGVPKILMGPISAVLIEGLEKYGFDAIDQVYKAFEGGSVDKILDVLRNAPIEDIRHTSYVTIEEMVDDEGVDIQIEDGARVPDDTAPGLFLPWTAGTNASDPNQILPPPPTQYPGNKLPQPLTTPEGENAEPKGYSFVPPGPQGPPGPSTAPNAPPAGEFTYEDLKVIFAKLINYIKYQRQLIEHARAMIEEMKKEGRDYVGGDKQLNEDILKLFLMYMSKGRDEHKKKLSKLMVAKSYYTYKDSIEYQRKETGRLAQRQPYTRPITTKWQYF